MCGRVHIKPAHIHIDAVDNTQCRTEIKLKCIDNCNRSITGCDIAASHMMINMRIVFVCLTCVVQHD